MRRRRPLTPLLPLWALATAQVPACPLDGAETVALVVNEDARDIVDERAIAAHVAATLAGRGAPLCLGAQPSARAQVNVAARGEESVSLVVEDRPSATRLERALDLTSVPPVGRGVLVALAVDQLLRAGQMSEPAVPPAPPPPAVTPPPEVRAVAPAPETPGPAPHLTTAFGVTRAGGLSLFGPVVTFEQPWSRRFALRLGAVAAWSAPVDGRNGAAAVQAVSGLVALAVRLTSPGPLAAALVPRLEAGQAWASGDPVGGAVGRSGSTATSSLSCAMELSRRIGRVRLGVALIAGYALRPVELVEEGRTFASTGGFRLGAEVGVGLDL